MDKILHKKAIDVVFISHSFKIFVSSPCFKHPKNWCYDTMTFFINPLGFIEIATFLHQSWKPSIQKTNIKTSESAPSQVWVHLEKSQGPNIRGKIFWSSTCFWKLPVRCPKKVVMDERKNNMWSKSVNNRYEKVWTYRGSLVYYLQRACWTSCLGTTNVTRSWSYIIHWSSKLRPMSRTDQQCLHPMITTWDVKNLS